MDAEHARLLNAHKLLGLKHKYMTIPPRMSETGWMGAAFLDACESGDVDTVVLLFENGVDVEGLFDGVGLKAHRLGFRGFFLGKLLPLLANIGVAICTLAGLYESNSW